MVMKNTLIQLNIRSNKDNLKDKKMKKSELRKLIREEIQTSFENNNLKEVKLTDIDVKVLLALLNREIKDYPEKTDPNYVLLDSVIKKLTK